MLRLAIFISASGLLTSFAFGQIQIDQSIEFTGSSNADRQVKNLGIPENPEDGISVGQFQKGEHIYSTSTGSNGQYALNLSPPIASYQEGMLIRFKANHANPGAAQISINGLGSVSLLSASGQPLQSDELAAGRMYEAIFDGTAFQLLGSSDANGAQNGNPDYTLACNKANVTTVAGANSAHDVATITCTLIPGSGSYLFPADTLFLSVLNAPAGITPVMAAPFGHLVPVFQTGLTFQVGSNVSTGTYTMQIQSEISGNIKTINIDLIIAVGKVVFITSTLWNGNLGGLSGADNKCQTEANSSPFSDKNFVAFIGNASVHAKDRIPDAIYYRPDGAIISTSKVNFLANNFVNPFSMTANGADWPSGTSEIWTGMGGTGGVTGLYTCTNWSTNCSSSSGSSCYGGYVYIGWLDGSGGFCNVNRRLLCVEQ